MGKESLQQVALAQLGIHRQKDEVESLPHTTYKKLIQKGKTIKLLEGNKSTYLHDPN